MTTSTLSHTGADHSVAHAAQAITAFLIAWFKATPAYLVYRAIKD